MLYIFQKFNIINRQSENVAAVVCIVGTSWTGGLASAFGGNLGIVHYSNIIHPFEYDKSSSILQLTNGKSRDL